MDVKSTPPLGGLLKPLLKGWVRFAASTGTRPADPGELRMRARPAHLAAIMGLLLAFAPGCGSALPPPSLNPHETHNEVPPEPSKLRPALTPAEAPKLLTGSGHICKINPQGRLECRDPTWAPIPTPWADAKADGLFELQTALGVFGDGRLLWPATRDGSGSYQRAIPPGLVQVSLIHEVEEDEFLGYGLDRRGRIHAWIGQQPATLLNLDFKVNRMVRAHPKRLVVQNTEGLLAAVLLDGEARVQQVEKWPADIESDASTRRVRCTVRAGKIRCSPKDGSRTRDIAWDQPVVELAGFSRTEFVARDELGRHFVFEGDSLPYRSPLPPTLLPIAPLDSTNLSEPNGGVLGLCSKPSHGKCITVHLDERAKPVKLVVKREQWVEDSARILPPPKRMRSAYGIGCHVDLAGTLRCWGRISSEDDVGMPELPRRIEMGAVADLAIGAERLCPLLEDGTLLCATRDKERFVDLRFRVVAQEVTSVRSSLAMLCWITSSGRAHCDGRLQHREHPVSVEGRRPLRVGTEVVEDATEVFPMASTTCIRRASGAVLCTAREGEAKASEDDVWPLQPTPSEAPVRFAASAGNELCFVRKDQRAFCSFDGGKEGRRTDSLDGGPLLAFDDFVARPDPTRLNGQGWADTLEQRPWSDLPTLKATASGQVEGFELSTGPEVVACKYSNRVTEPTICYGALPQLSAPIAGIEALGKQDRVRRLRGRPRLLRRRAAQARMYEMTTAEDSFWLKDNKAKLCESAHVSRARGEDCDGLEKRGVQLPDADAAEIEQLVRDPLSYSNVLTHCYAPHHEVIYFDAKQRILARIEVCFSCSLIDTLPVVQQPGEHWGNFGHMNYLRRACHAAGLKGCDLH